MFTHCFSLLFYFRALVHALRSFLTFTPIYDIPLMEVIIMPTYKKSVGLKQISQHIKIIRFGSRLTNKNPWKKIIGIFKFGKKIDIENLLNQKGFEDGQ